MDGNNVKEYIHIPLFICIRELGLKENIMRERNATY